MKPGSIVVVKPVPYGQWRPYIKWVPVQDENTPYMVRQIRDEHEGEPGILFEEGVIGYTPKGVELGIKMSYVKEILPPEDIAEEVEDMMCVPLKEDI